MSFLAGRLAGKEAAYFYKESKHAVARLAEKPPKTKTPINTTTNSDCNSEAAADILPEILQHSLPSKILGTEIPCEFESSLTTSPKWSIQNSTIPPSSLSLSHRVINPLCAHLSLPRVTLGPNRWQFPQGGSKVTASTANELRLERERHSHTVNVDPDKVRAAAEGFAQIGKAFAIATAIIIGSSSLSLAFAASHLHIRTSDDIRAKGRDLVQPKFYTIREQLSPLRDWAENTSKKWSLKSEQDIKERPIIKELSKILRAKDSS